MYLSLFVYDSVKQLLHFGFSVWFSQVMHEQVCVEVFAKVVFVDVHVFS